MKRILLIAALIGAFLGVHPLAVTHATSAASDAAHACQQGGYASLMGTDGTTFLNAGQCTSYVAKGGSIVGLAACSVVPGISGCVTLDNVSIPAFAGGSGTMTLSGVFSFAPTASDCDEPQLTNCGPAVGGGTYTVSGGTFNGGTKGTFSTVETVSTSYTSLPCSSSSIFEIIVQATFTDSSSGATMTAYVVPSSWPGVWADPATPLYISFSSIPGVTVTC